MEYTIVTTDAARSLETHVQTMIGKGWEPLGGVSCSLSETSEERWLLFAQAMIKRS
jgi:hypothetical protein